MRSDLVRLERIDALLVCLAQRRQLIVESFDCFISCIDLRLHALDLRCKKKQVWNHLLRRSLLRESVPTLFAASTNPRRVESTRPTRSCAAVVFHRLSSHHCVYALQFLVALQRSLVPLDVALLLADAFVGQHQISLGSLDETHIVCEQKRKRQHTYV